MWNKDLHKLIQHSKSQSVGPGLASLGKRLSLVTLAWLYKAMSKGLLECNIN